jgi:hypothetical protein
MHDHSGVIAKTFAGRRQFYAAAAASDQRDAEIALEPLDPRAGRCESQMGAHRALSDAAGVGDSHEKLKVNQVKSHGGAPGFETSAFVIAEC